MLEKIKKNKKELLILALFIVTNLLFILRGTTKYIILSLISVAILLFKRKLEPKHYILLVHSFVYLLIGYFFAFINNTINYMSISQSFIYLSAGFTAMNYYSLTENKDTVKFLDLQLYGICIAYTILYIFFKKDSSFFWETHVYGYILGLYIVLYFCQKRYSHMVLSLIFMLMEHKRIVCLAVLITIVFVLSFKLFKKEESKEKLFYFYLITFFFASFVWIYMMSTDFLSETLRLTDKITSLRMTLWHSAVKYYDFSPMYFGKGIGWVKTWMRNEGVFDLDTLHNDFLVGYIELGFVGYLLWIISFISQFMIMKKTVKKECLFIGLTFFFYMFLNFLTDNVYIYISFMMPFYLMILSLFFGDDNDKYIRILNDYGQ